MQPAEQMRDETQPGRGTVIDEAGATAFHGIVELAMQICDAPVALVSFAAADRNRFVSQFGFAPGATEVDGLVRRQASAGLDLLVIPDLAQDGATPADPLAAGSTPIRFFAGARMLAASGEVLGSLCAIDSAPRPGGLSDAQASGLATLARQVVSQLDLRRAVADRDALLAGQRQAEIRRHGLLRLGDRLRDLETIAEMTQEASAIVGETLAVGRAGFGRIDETGEHITVEPDWTAGGLASITGRHRFDDYGDLTAELRRGEPLVIEDVTTDPRTAADPSRMLALGIRALVNMPVRERGRTVAAFLVHDGRPRVWTPEVLAFLRNVADRVEVGVARLNAQVQQNLLNQELSHRMKNSFAMVQAIASQTLRTVPDREPVEAFARRLQTLSRAHDLLLQQSWSGARLDDVARTVLAAVVDVGRLDMQGPGIDLVARVALSVSLLLHELATNALKHGSLSVEGGRVAIAWSVTEAKPDPELVLSWRETGGPPATPSKRKGFGSRLIQAGLVGTGGVDLRYLATRFEAEFTAPLSQVLRT